MAALGSMCLRSQVNLLRFLPRLAPTNHGSVSPFVVDSVPISPASKRSYSSLVTAYRRQKSLAGNVKLCVIGPAVLSNLGSSWGMTWHWQCYSTSEKGSTTGTSITGGLADEILKSKVGETASQSEKEQTHQKDSNKSDDKKKNSYFSPKNAWKMGLLSLGMMGLFMGGSLLFLWGAPIFDKEGNELKDEFSTLPMWQAYPRRTVKEFHFFKKMIQEPSSEKLLPDGLKEPYYQPKFTLVLELTGVLVHPDWTLNTGWRFKKRPGVDYFLQQITYPTFEVVVYTHEQGMTAFPIIDGLDPNGHVTFRLFRDATRYTNGTHVKDLGCLNRDLSKVLIVDCDPKGFQLHPRNALLLKKWKGDDEDRTLIDLANFLRTIAVSDVEDVRTVLEHYNQFDDPLEAFKENQRKVQEQHEHQARTATENQEKKSLVGSWSRGLSGRRR